MAANSARDRARVDLARLAKARLDNDGFRWEAASILHRAVGFDGWCWLLADPGTRLPTRDLGENVIAGQSIRRFSRRHPEAWVVPWQRSAQPVAVTSAVTGGAHLHRDSSAGFFSADDAGFLAEVAPMLAARLRDGLRTRLADGDAGPRDDPAEPGTIIVDEELSVVATTPTAWDWIGRLGLGKPSDAEPLPGFIYSVATCVALSRARGADPPPCARARLQAADGKVGVSRRHDLAAVLTGTVHSR